MQITSIEYKKLFNRGNFEHESLSVQIELEDGETPHEAVKRAKAFVEREMKERPNEHQYEGSLKILAFPDDFTGKEVKQAEETVRLY